VDGRPKIGVLRGNSIVDIAEAAIRFEADLSQGAGEVGFPLPEDTVRPPCIGYLLFRVVGSPEFYVLEARGLEELDTIRIETRELTVDSVTADLEGFISVLLLGGPVKRILRFGGIF
jgi:hypothetical protein